MRGTKLDMKKLICILLSIIFLTACNYNNESNAGVGGTFDSENENGGTSQKLYDIISKDDIANIEAIKITPWEFVKDYSPVKNSNNKYVFSLYDDFLLKIILSEKWKDTYVTFTDELSGETQRLCYESEFFADNLYAKREGRYPKNKFLSYNFDKSAFVEIAYEVINISENENEFTIFTKPSLSLNSEQPIKLEGYSFYNNLVWSPDNKHFSVNCEKTIFSETDFSPIFIYNTEDNTYLLITENDIPLKTDDGYTLRVFSNIKWSPSGDYMLLRLVSERDKSFYKYYIGVYDFKIKKILYLEETEIDVYSDNRELMGIYNNIYEYNFSWDKIK